MPLGILSGMGAAIGSGFSCSCVIYAASSPVIPIALTHGRSTYSLVPRIKLVGRVEPGAILCKAHVDPPPAGSST
jgi:hypothetical protein